MGSLARGNEQALARTQKALAPVASAMDYITQAHREAATRIGAIHAGTEVILTRALGSTREQRQLARGSREVSDTEVTAQAERDESLLRAVNGLTQISYSAIIQLAMNAPELADNRSDWQRGWDEILGR